MLNMNYELKIKDLKADGVRKTNILKYVLDELENIIDRELLSKKSINKILSEVSCVVEHEIYVSEGDVE